MNKIIARTAVAAFLLSTTAMSAFAFDASKINVPNYIPGQTIFRGMDVPPTVKVDDQALIDAVRRASLSAVPAELILHVPTSAGQWDTQRVVTNVISRSAWGDPAQRVPGNVVLLIVGHGDNGELFTAVKPGPNFHGYDSAKLNAIVDAARQQYSAQLAKGDLVAFSTTVDQQVAQYLKQVEIAAQPHPVPVASSGGIGFGTILLIVAGVAAVGGGLWFVFGRSGSNAPAQPLQPRPVTPAPRPVTPTPRPVTPTPAAPPAVSERKKNQILRRLSNTTGDFNRMTSPGYYSVGVGFNTYHPPLPFISTSYGANAANLLAQANRHIHNGNWLAAEAVLNQLSAELAQGDRYMYWSTYNTPLFLADPYAVSYAAALGFTIGMEFALYDAYLADRYIWAGDSLLFAPPAYEVVTAPGFVFAEVIQPDYVVLDTPVAEVITPDSAIIAAAPGGIEVVDTSVAAEVVNQPDNSGWGNASTGATIEDRQPETSAPVDNGNNGWSSQTPAPDNSGWGNASTGATIEDHQPEPSAPVDNGNNGWGNTPAQTPVDNGWGNNSSGATVEDRPSYTPDPTPSYSAPDPTPSYTPDTSYSAPDTGSSGGWGGDN